MHADMVLSQLEVLKYFGGKRATKGEPGHDALPTGEGIPTNIVVLPSLLLDVRAYNIGGGTGKVCAVGGRAARALCALLNLVDDYDGTFSVSLMTKTGNLGRLLLENEFHDPDSDHTFYRLDGDFIWERDGEPRCSLWRKEDERPDPRDPQEHDELTVQDIESMPRAVRAIEEARAVYLASLRTPHADKLLAFLIHRVKPGTSAALFLDTSRVQGEDRCTQLLDLAAGATQQRIVIFTSGDQAGWVRHAMQRRSHNAYDQLTVIHYEAPASGTVEAQITCMHAGWEFSEHGDIPFSREDVPEHFKAGVILAHSLYQTVSDPDVPIPDGLRQHLRHEWEAPDDEGRTGEPTWRKIIQFAVEFAQAEVELKNRGLSARKGHALLRQLVEDPEEAMSRHLPAEPVDLSLPLRTIRQGQSKVLDVEQADITRLAQLAGGRRTNQLQCSQLPLCRRPACDGKCPKSGHAEPRVAAVLIDLDGTLMDSAEQRDRCLEAALSHLKNHGIWPVGCQAIADATRFFERYVYDPWLVYKALDMGDFRQQWNLREWYVTYIVLAQSNDQALVEDIVGLAKELGIDPHPEDVRTKVHDADWVEGFRSQCRIVSAAYQDQIAEAQAAFQSVTMRPFKEARDFLLSLQQTVAFKLYVVSEGDPQTQWMKIVRSGLSEFFDQQCVLTTGDATESERERDSLMQERSDIGAELATVSTRLRQHRERHAELAEILDDVASAMLKQRPWIAVPAEQLTDIPKCVIGRHMSRLRTERAGLAIRERIFEEYRNAATLAAGVLDRMARKRGVSFYAAAIRSILRAPGSPLAELRSFSSLLEPTDPNTTMKLAIIGDRFSADIKPPLQLLEAKKLLAIRLNSGRYARREPAYQAGPPSPAYIADTLAQAKAILLSREAWDQIECTSAPPIFALKIDLDDRDRLPEKWHETECRVGIDHVLCGVAMDPDRYPTVHSICFAILWEHLTRCDVDERDSLLQPFLNPPNGDRAYEDIRRRVGVLCALARSCDAMGSPEMPGLRDSLKERLSKDRELLSRAEGGVLIRAGCWDRDKLIDAINEALRTLGEGEGTSRR